MKPICTGAIAAALLALTTVSAQADCAAELARMTEGGAAAGGGISKDGSLAPLEGGDSASGTDASGAGASGTDMAASGTAAAEGGEGIAKDGSHTPMESAGGQQPGVAMSGADAQAQQEGQPTAAEQATGAAAGHSARDAHMKAARDALAAGDEDACMKALQAAESS
ncbi:hypothetical protein [Paracoccus benzoatiresistens]|uniref:Uncharacterized protein n=1 Tax=Paracoccus benzoatiresistens TaxID=2997341 RepID=A0ABT4IZJ8_9RHOB|nr:hypothetical protein [Paracoccus sp. EF6]MCZ0960272.1 hypothetical protein [Paracoccus sp. EF6]